MRPNIPPRGRDHAEILSELQALRETDANWRDGRVFSLVYHAGEAHERLLGDAHRLYAATNGLNPMAFKSLKRLEAEVIGMAAALMHGPSDAVGVMTSGGTESILVAVQTYRDRAKNLRGVTRGELVVPETIHPAFDKAAHYFGVELVKTKVTRELRADPKAMARAITRRTIALVGSAPQYPHGLVDPIDALGEVAARHGLPLHVDACVGGFVLPWVERLGRELPRWDFRVPGVTSISADLHKYGYAAKGASTLLWRSMEDMKHQFFIATEWPGGIYASPSMAGTRPGGPIAAAWAALVAMGEDGYLEATRRALEAADALRAGIAEIPGLRVLGDSRATIVAWGVDDDAGLDVFAIADALEQRGWTVDRQQRPNSVHLTVTQNHLAAVPAYLTALREARDVVAADPTLRRAGTAAMYGMMAKVPLRGMVEGSIRKVMQAMYAPGVVVPDLDAATKDDGLVGRLVEKLGPDAIEWLDAAGARVRAVRAKGEAILGRRGD
jgi:glutamate/tyrosine decarboxylase-like PLP-dependent enzyme